MGHPHAPSLHPPTPPPPPTQSPLTSAVEAWWTNLVGGRLQSVDDVRLLGIMSMPKASSKLKLDFSSLLGPLIYT